MAKKKVKFKITDGLRPRKSEGSGKPFELRLPMDIAVASMSNTTVKLGLSCEVPLVVVRGTSIRVVAPGEDISIEILNPNQATLALGMGEVVARGFCLDNSDCELDVG
jgi:hypothetical protein